MAAESSLSSLMAEISWWEIAEYTSLACVIVGVAAESVHQLTEWFKSNSWWERFGGKAGALLLIAALATELVTTIKVNSINGLAIAFLGDQEAATRLRAAEIEQKYAWRIISAEQRAKLVAALAGFAFPVYIEYSRADPEAFEYTNHFFNTLSQTSLKVTPKDIVPFIPTRGIKVIGPSTNKEDLAKALTSAGFDYYTNDETPIGDEQQGVVRLSIGGKLPPS